MASSKRLTVKGVSALKTPGRYADGDGLYLKVRAGGGKHWVVFFGSGGRGGKRQELGLGPLTDEMGLVAARAAAEEVRKNLAAGKPAVVEKPKPERAKVKAEKPAITFGEVADEFIDTMAPSWRGAETEPSWRRSVEKYGKALRDRLEIHLQWRSGSRNNQKHALGRPKLSDFSAFGLHDPGPGRPISEFPNGLLGRSPSTR